MSNLLSTWRANQWPLHRVNALLFARGSSENWRGPTSPSPPPLRTPGFRHNIFLKAPPTRVDDLMTELSEFDPSIQPTGFVEPPPKTETDYARQYRDRSASPPRKPHQGSPTRSRSSPPPASKSGPAVYYPPGKLYSPIQRYFFYFSINLKQNIYRLLLLKMP